MQVQVNGSVIPNGREVFAGLDPTLFDFVRSPALTNIGVGRVVRVICPRIERLAVRHRVTRR